MSDYRKFALIMLRYIYFIIYLDYKCINNTCSHCVILNVRHGNNIFNDVYVWYLLRSLDGCRVLWFACLCVRSHISKKHILVVAWSFADDSAVRYEHLVLWMTSCFHIMFWHWQYRRGCHAAASSLKFPTYLPGFAMLLDIAVIYNNSKLQTGSEVCCLWLPCSYFAIFQLFVFVFALLNCRL